MLKIGGLEVYRFCVEMIDFLFAFDRIGDRGARQGFIYRISPS